MANVAGLYMLAFPNRDLLFFADTTVNISPDASTLADVALLSADFVRELGLGPDRDGGVLELRFGAPPGVGEGGRGRPHRARARPGLDIDGEMQADTAVDPR